MSNLFRERMHRIRAGSAGFVPLLMRRGRDVEDGPGGGHLRRQRAMRVRLLLRVPIEDARASRATVLRAPSRATRSRTSCTAGTAARARSASGCCAPSSRSAAVPPVWWPAEQTAPATRWPCQPDGFQLSITRVFVSISILAVSRYTSGHGTGVMSLSNRDGTDSGGVTTGVRGAHIRPSGRLHALRQRSTMGRAFLMSHATALAGDLALFLGRHGGEPLLAFGRSVSIAQPPWWMPRQTTRRP